MIGEMVEGAWAPQPQVLDYIDVVVRVEPAHNRPELTVYKQRIGLRNGALVLLGEFPPERLETYNPVA